MSGQALLLPSPNWYSVGITEVSQCEEYFVYAAKNTIVVLRCENLELHGFLMGHSGRVVCIRFSRNGLLCSLGTDQTIRVWDVIKCASIRVLGKQPPGLILLDHLTKDAGMIVADKKGGLFLWKDLKGGKFTKMKTQIGSSITFLSSIPHSNSKVVVGCEDGSVFLVDILTDQCIKTLADLPGSIQSISWVEITAAPAKGPTVHVSLIAEEVSPEEAENRVRVNLEVLEEIQIMLLGSLDGTVQLWLHSYKGFSFLQTLWIPDLTTEAPQRSSWVVCKAFKTHSNKSSSPDQWITVLGSKQGELFSWKTLLSIPSASIRRVEGPQTLPKLHQRVVFSVDVFPDQNLVRFITTSMDRTVVLWTAENYNMKLSRSIANLSCLGGDILAMDCSSSSCLAIGSTEKTIKLLLMDHNPDGHQGLVKTKWRGISDQVINLRWSPKGQLLAFACKDKTVGLLGEKDKYFIYPGKTRNGVVSLDWRFISQSGNHEVWELFVLDRKGILVSYPMIYDSDFHDTQQDFQISSQTESYLTKKELQPTNVTSIVQSQASKETFTALKFTPRSEYLILGTKEGRIVMFEVPAKFQDAHDVCCLQIASERILNLEWDPTETKLLTRTENGSLVILSLSKPHYLQVTCRVKVHHLTSVQWSACQNKILYTLHNQKHFKVWSVNDHSIVEVMDLGSLQKQKLTSFGVHPKKSNTLLLASILPSLVEVTHPDISLQLNSPSVVPKSAGIRPVRLQMEYKEDLNVVLVRLLVSETIAKKKKEPQKRKFSILKNKQTIVYQKNSSQLLQLIEQIPKVLFSNQACQKTIWKDLESWGLFESPLAAEKFLEDSICSEESPEISAMKYLWIENYSKAAKILFENNKMSGEFLPFFIPSGKRFYTSLVDQYISYLQTQDEPHLASLHCLTKGEISEAIEIYQTAGLHDEAVSLAGVKFLNEDPNLHQVFVKRGMSHLHNEPESLLVSTVDLLIGRKLEDVIQILETCREPKLYILASRLIDSAARKNEILEGVEKESMMSVLRKSLLYCTISKGSDEDTQMIRGHLLRLKENQICCGDLLFCDVLREMRSGYFSEIIESVNKRILPCEAIFTAGLSSIPCFKRYYELMEMDHRPLLGQLITDVNEMSQLVLDETAVRDISQSAEICKWFLWNLHGLEKKALQAQLNLRFLLPQSTEIKTEVEILPRKKNTTNQPQVIRYTKQQLLDLETDAEIDRRRLDDSIIPVTFRL